jgi:pimeloyl-ACP methyl ester carboxylesterase
MSHRASPVRRLFGRGHLFALAALALGILALSGRGEVIILKDGYAIHGKVVTEQVTFNDKNGQQIITQKVGGLTLMDDGPRLTVFSAHYKRVGDVDPQNKFAEFVTLTRLMPHKTAYQLPSVMELSSQGPFNANWVRTLVYRNPFQPQNPHRIEQFIKTLTPHYVRMESISHVWASYCLTSELGSETVRALLRTHPELIEKDGPDAGKRARVIRFLIQADWLNEAESEIETMLRVLPAETKRADEFREIIRDARLERAIADVERAKEAGQHDQARRIMSQLPKDKLPAKFALRVAALKAEYDANLTKLEKATRYLRELQQVTNGAKFKEIIQAADMILGDIHLDGISRLDLFITLTEQSETARKEGNAPLHPPEQLLAAAVTGWLMGNNGTALEVETARKFLKARELALNYLREPLTPKRFNLIQQYNADPEALPFDELEKLISLLPPPEAEKDTSTTAADKTTGPLPGTASGARYLLKLPPEYRHGRAYPLLIILPEGGERPADVLKRFGDLPSRHGFIVAVLDWSTGFKATYNYSDEEQALVTGLVRHLRRTLHVDSDRVFIFGDGEGANFALDMGATHPDLFAGVVPMTPTPSQQLFRVFGYWKNFQNLPVYMIVGDRAGDSIKTIRDILTDWMQRGYPALAVSYKGRGYEWFGEELPYVFDWMTRKTRATGFPDLGGLRYEYRTIRASSNRFYWVSTDEIEQGRLFDPMRPNRQFDPATIQAHVTEGNFITVETMGLRQVSIWLARGSVDFAKPVSVKLKGLPHAPWRKELTPKISVLLEDLYERGDRQRPSYQRIDCKDLHKLVQLKISAQ